MEEQTKEARQKDIEKAIYDLYRIRLIFLELLKWEADELLESVTDEGIGDHALGDVGLSTDEVLIWHKHLINELSGSTGDLLDRLHKYALVVHHTGWLLKYQAEIKADK